MQKAFQLADYPLKNAERNSNSCLFKDVREKELSNLNIPARFL